MLKKSLHYLIRCSFLLANIICLSIFLNSCITAKEDYLSFLRQNKNYSFEVMEAEKLIMKCNASIEHAENRSNMLFEFTYPSALEASGIKINICDNNIKYYFADDELLPEDIPSLWKEIFSLFETSGRVADYKKIKGSGSVIKVQKDNETEISYTLDNNGNLIEINTENLKIIVKEKTND